MARLVWLMGPSGSGKDSLLDALREAPPERVLIAHRYITRPAFAGGENHVALTDHEFARRCDAGLFAIHWQAHGYQYALGVEIDLWLQRGYDVLVNGSRLHLDAVRQRYGDHLLPVELRVSRTVLEQRLRQRGRENEEGIAGRLRRADSPPVVGAALLDNNGPLPATLAALRHLLVDAVCDN